MSKIQAFFAHNVKKPENIKKVISDRFTDEDGNAIEFEFKAISAKKDEELKQKCTVKKMITQGKRKGQYDTDFLASKYQTLLAIESLVEPNLKDAKLQESWGVFGEEELFYTMFLSAEVTDVIRASQEANGYDIDMDELVEEAKN